MKRIISVLLISFLLFSSVLVLPSKSHAELNFTKDDNSKLTKVVRALGEKIGVKWSVPALTTTVGYFASQIKNGGKFQDWWLDFLLVPDIVPPDDDYSKYLLSPDDFKNGIGLLKDATENVKTDEIIPYYGQCAKSDSQYLSKLNYANFIEYEHVVNVSTGQTQRYLMTWRNNDATISGSTTTFGYVRVINTGPWYIYNSTTGERDNYWDTAPDDYTNTVSSNAKIIASSIISGCDYTVKNDDVMNTSNVNTTIFNNIDNSTTNYNYYTDYPIQVSKTATTEDIDTPWNEPLTVEVINNIYPPAVPDDGGTTNPPAEIPDDFFGIMEYMSGKVIDTYNGIVKFAGDSVIAMKNLTQGTAGLVVFLGDFFSWLPAPFVSVLTVGFMMGVIAYWFRR